MAIHFKDSIWFDNLKGAYFTEENAEALAEWVGGKLEGGFLIISLGRGDMVVRDGDFIGRDQSGRWHISRHTLFDAEDMKRDNDAYHNRPKKHDGPKPGPTNVRRLPSSH